MPFFRCVMPPIGLGLLKAALSKVNLPSTIYNFNLDLLPELGDTAETACERYEWISDNLPWALASEWIFAPPDPATDEHYLSLLPDCGFAPERISLLTHLRSRVDDLVERWAQRIVAAGHDIVGFSCSLGRTRANSKLAEAIRELAPQTRLLIGGFEASGEMGRALLEAFPVFDLACHIEADELIVPIIRGLRAEPGFSLEALHGISFRQGDRLVSNMDAVAPVDIENIPLPDYDDYFEQVSALRASWDERLDFPSYLPIETARGCWWGAHRHCVFCSVNGDRIRFLSKSADRVLFTLDALHTRYGGKRFLVVDNILNNEYFQTLLPRLGELGRNYLLEFEVRPNLTQAKIAKMARAGIAWVQPGIESLSTPALVAMNKGTTAIDNIQTMKWLMAYDIKCSWNFLFSLPGERIEWYEDVVGTLKRLKHLDPPRGPHRISMQRFSPYFLQGRKFGVNLLGPTLFSRLTFSDLSADLVERFSYGFDYEIEGRPPDLDNRITSLLTPLLAQWRSSFEEHGCTLSLIDGPDESLLVEGPLFEAERIFCVRGLLRALLKGCESIQVERLLLERLTTSELNPGDYEATLAPRAYREVVAELCLGGARPEELSSATISDVIEVADQRGWIYRESGRILSLPVNQTRFVQSEPFQLEATYRRCLTEDQE